MTSARQIAANRKNGRRSHGPRTAEGKARTKFNALRHGLATRVSDDSSLAPEIERLMRHLASGSADPNRLAQAKEIAESEFEVWRIRRVRTALIDGAVDHEAPQPERAEVAILRVVAQLAKLDRRERRALSRRKRAIREFRGWW
jgi:hypothetical protein